MQRFFIFISNHCIVPSLTMRFNICFCRMHCQADDETCRIVVTTQDLSSHPAAPQTTILLSSEPLPIVEESPAVREAVDLLPTLTAPPPVQPQPLPEIATTTTVIEQRSLAQELKESNMSAR